MSLRPNGARRGGSHCGPPRCVSDYHFCRRQGPRASDERPPKISVRKISKRAGLEGAKTFIRRPKHRQASLSPFARKRVMSPLPPELLARQPGALGHRPELEIDDVGHHRAESGEGAEAAVRARHDAFAPDDV